MLSMSNWRSNIFKLQLVPNLPSMVKITRRNHQPHIRGVWQGNCLLKINSWRSQTLPGGGEQSLNKDDSQSQSSLAKWQLTKRWLIVSSCALLHKIGSRNNVHTSKKMIVLSRKSSMKEFPSRDRNLKLFCIDLLRYK